MKYLIKIIINTEYIYFINSIQNILKNKLINKINIIEFFRCENRNCYYLVNYEINDHKKDNNCNKIDNNFNKIDNKKNIEFYEYFEKIIKDEEKYIKNIYPEFLNNWDISFEIY